MLNPFKAIRGHFDPEKFKKLYVVRASKINTSNYANGSTNLLSFINGIKFIGIAFRILRNL